jgi:hypothetical protein
MHQLTRTGLVAIVTALAFVAPAAGQVIGEKEETLTSEGDLDVGAVQEEIEEAAATESAEQAEGGPWVPPAPSPEEMDWIKMSSGEWLKGDFQRMVDGTVYFDSDEFDDLQVDWADIAELRSPRKHTYRFPGRRIATGTAVMKEGKLLIDTGQGVVAFDQAKLVGMMEGEPKEINYWSAKVNVGLAARSGNTSQLDLTSFARITRRTSLTRFNNEYNGAYSTANSTKTANSHRLNSAFDIYLTQRFFLIVPSAEVFVDPFQNLSLRITPGAGLGYDVLVGKRVDWEVGVQGLYQYTSFETVTAGRSTTAHDVAIGLSTQLDLDITSDLEWDTSYKTQLVATDFNKTSQNLTSILSMDILGPIEIDLTFNWDWIKSPERRADGTAPVSSDYRISAGLGIDI